ncbi:MAG TPA: hypothetical protein VN577_21640 [Terriglobales bacterium]|nr:hypothetical protein [Terriglobales bacterium]
MNLGNRLRWCVLCILALVSPAWGSDWSLAATDLAKAIASASGPGSITLTVTNSSSLPKDQVGEIQRAIEAQLRTSGVSVGAVANVHSEVRVTLSENLQGYLWIAEVKQGNNTQVAMVSVPRAQSAAPTKSGPTVVISKSLLWSQPTQFVDALVFDRNRLIVLEADLITSYTQSNSTWERQQSWNVARNHPFPRDLRGLLVPGDKSVDAYLPGTVCTVSLGRASSVICRDGEDAWKLGPRSAFFNSARNYFNGALVPASENQNPPFYSAAWLQRQNNSLAIFTGVDGRVRLNDGVNERTLSMNITGDWGSDIAAVRSACGSGTQLLVTAAADDTQPDSLRAYEIPDGEPVLVSGPVAFAGPITALWTHDANTATAIAHNLRTGQYEAYSVSITCNQ